MLTGCWCSDVCPSELGAERLLCQPALAHDLAVPDLVAARLSGPAAISGDLARDLERVRAIIAHEEFDALRARPAFGVEARVEDEAARAEGERLEIPQAARESDGEGKSGTVGGG